MKRKITELEQTLIDKGFRLDHKTYGGKHSQYVETYTYKGIVEVNYDSLVDYVKVDVVINSKKDKILDIYMENKVDTLSSRSLKILNSFYYQVETFIYKKDREEIYE